MKKRLTIILILLIVLTISGCKKEISETELNENVEETPEESGIGIEAGSTTIETGEEVNCPAGKYLMKDSRGVWCADPCTITMTFLHDQPTEVQYPCACPSEWKEETTDEGNKLLSCTV